MKRFLIVFFLVLLICPAFAQLGEIGIYPLRTDVGARPLGMGGAFVGLANDSSAVFYNPGGLAWAKGISLTIKDFDNLAAAQAYPTGSGSSFGLAIVKTRQAGIPYGTGEAASNNNVIILSYGTKLSFIPALYRQETWRRVGLGISLKGLFDQSLRRTGELDRSATGWDMDLGVLWRGEDWWSLGATLQNILPAKTLGGGEIVWGAGAPEGIPASLKLGGSAQIIGDINAPIFHEGRELILAGELDFSNAAPVLLRLGGEWALDKKYYFRTGIMQHAKPGGVVTGLNFGAGIHSDEWGLDLTSFIEPLRQENTVSFAVNYSPKEWVVIKRLDVERPSVLLEKAIEKISIEDNMVTYDDRIEVFGKVKPGVDVYVNDQRAETSDDNTFKVIIPLLVGKNLVVVEARFEGEKKIWKYKVLREIKISVTEERLIKSAIEKAATAEDKETLKKKSQAITEKRKKVEELVTLGVIEVTPEAEFKLDAGISRGELAVWLIKSAGIRLLPTERDLFSDVRRDHPLAIYIKAAVDAGLMSGFPDGTFRPAAPVTKQEGEALFKLLRLSQQ